MLILFDAAGTLIELAEPVEAVYARHFGEIGVVAEAPRLAAAFVDGFRAVPEPAFPAGGHGEAIERDWWREVVAHAARACGWTGGGNFDGCFDTLFTHYASGSAWRPFSETAEVLAELRAAGAKTGVVSNFDRRLHRVLRELDLARHFDLILTSADVGARKPSPRLIHEAMHRLRRNDEPVFLVGDSPREDGGAAEAAGIPAFLLDRPARSLRHLAAWLEQSGKRSPSA